jgi:hypothetical protein
MPAAEEVEVTGQSRKLALMWVKHMWHGPIDRSSQQLQESALQQTRPARPVPRPLPTPPHVGHVWWQGAHADGSPDMPARRFSGRRLGLGAKYALHKGAAAGGAGSQGSETSQAIETKLRKQLGMDQASADRRGRYAKVTPSTNAIDGGRADHVSGGSQVSQDRSDDEDEEDEAESRTAMYDVSSRKKETQAPSGPHAPAVGDPASAWTCGV